MLNDVAAELRPSFVGTWSYLHTVLAARTTPEFRAKLKDFVETWSRWVITPGALGQLPPSESLHDALSRLLEVANSSSEFGLKISWRKLRALLRFCQVAAALVDDAPFFPEESPPDTQTPSHEEKAAQPPDPMTRVRIAALVAQLQSADDQQRAAADTALHAGGRVSQIGQDVVVALAEHMVAVDETSDPSMGYTGTVLADALGQIRHDDATSFKSWLVSADSKADHESAVARAIIGYAGSVTPDLLKDLSLLLPTAGPRAQAAVLDAFTQMFQNMTIGVGETAMQLALIEAMLLASLDSAPAQLLPSCVRICGFHPMPPVAFLRAVLAWGDKETRPEVLAELAPTLGRLGPRLWERLVQLRSEATVIGKAIVAAREHYVREPFDVKGLAEFLYNELPIDFDHAAQWIVLQLAEVPPVDALGRLERWIAGDDSAFDDTPVGESLSLRSQIEQFLDSLADHPDPIVVRAVRAALTRLLLPTESRQTVDATDRAAEALLTSLAIRIPDPQHLLRALLDATNDVVPRGPAHDVATAVAALLCTSVPSAAHSVIEHLSETDDWRHQEQAFATLAELGRRSPALLNEELGASLAPRLLAACFHENDFEIRAFAITTLGSLRRIGPDVGAALLACCRDVDTVRAAAIVAAQRFQQFDPAVLDNLLPALTGPSAGAAYAATLVLKALAISRQAIEQPTFRERIAEALAIACIHPEASREVEGPEYTTNSLGDACYQALMEVTGS
ncbi:Hypothetical protein A7982_08814 [Minicystis rosea]|nr:Hypothetical protein A7982_08814 [Minicystis rosea]